MTCDSRVCHVSVNTTLAVPSWTSPGTASYGLVVPKSSIAKGEIVHAALRSCANSKGFEHHIRHSLRREHVSSHNCDMLGRVKEGTRRNYNIYRV